MSSKPIRQLHTWTDCERYWSTCNNSTAVSIPVLSSQVTKECLQIVHSLATKGVHQGPIAQEAKLLDPDTARRDFVAKADIYTLRAHVSKSDFIIRNEPLSSRTARCRRTSSL